MNTVLATLAGLFLWSFLAATILPLASEVPLVLAVHSLDQLWLPVLVAAVGNYFGAATTWWLGRAAGRRLIHPERLKPSQERARRWLQRWGPPALLVSWLPVVGDALVAAAGAVEVPFATFSCWTFPGKLLRYLACAWLAQGLAS